MKKLQRKAKIEAEKNGSSTSAATTSGGDKNSKDGKTDKSNHKTYFQHESIFFSFYVLLTFWIFFIVVFYDVMTERFGDSVDGGGNSSLMSNMPYSPNGKLIKHLS